MARQEGGSPQFSRRSVLSSIAAPMVLRGQTRRAGGARPNVLFLILDDLNDWVGCLKSHPQAYTPNIDALAARGVNFTNAHVQAPLCNPSRSSFLTGLRPSTTGIYGLSPSVRAVEPLRNHVTMPQHFTEQGYNTLALGKIYHVLEPQYRAREFQTWLPAPAPARPEKRIGKGDFGGTLVDWGAFPERDEDVGDYRLADLAIDKLKGMPRDKPFYLAVGFNNPHVPCYAPQRWFDRLPLDQVILPPMQNGDRQDTPEFSWYLHWKLPEPRLAWYEKLNELPQFVRSYLAATSFVDAQVGRVLSTLASTGQDRNTVVVLTGDNGYHLGEKEITGKNTLWERSTHVPLIIAGPGIAPRTVADPAELLDIYPTLIELTGLPARTGLEGRSLVPQMRGRKRTAPAITTANAGNHGVRSERWRYIRYADGSEELYDMRADPHEWKNLAKDPKYTKKKQELATWLPKKDAPHVPGSASRILTPNPAGGWMWEGEAIVPGQIPMEPTFGATGRGGRSPAPGPAGR